MLEEALRRIESREARIGVVGLGYVGLPLLLEFAKAGFPVTGMDCDPQKLTALAAGESYIRHIGKERVKGLAAQESLVLSADMAVAVDCDAILVCVPTPLSSHRDPDLSFVKSTAESLAPFVKKGQLVVLESTTYPGTTDEVMTPILEQGCGLTAERDFFVAYSPEREDPSNPKFSTATIPKVVGGLGPQSLAVAQKLYDAVICETVPVSSCRAAEATKLMENIFRCVNIALVNELKMIFSHMDIDVWEVIEAAKTKPFGFMPFYPGPGLGGHCIPIDPFYLTWKAKEYGDPTKFIELAGEINTAMPDYVINQTMLALNARKLALSGSRICLVGLAYKKNVDDIRESPTFVIWEHLEKLGAEVTYYDPYCATVPATREHANLTGRRGIGWDEINRERFDAAIVCTAHDCVDHAALTDKLDLIVDTRGVCPKIDSVWRA